MKKGNKQAYAKWIKQELTNLGPAYIKIGQVASTRKDIFPIHITEVLETLQDNVKEIEFTYMDEVFKDEFGVSSQNYFNYINTTPIATASIAQVYIAVMNNGKNVIVKIQKPGLLECVNEDLDVIQKTLSLLPKNMKMITDLSLIVNESVNNLITELDFKNEMNNITDFRNKFESFNNINIPRVYEKAGKTKVLIMEYLPGIKLNKLNGTNHEAISNELMTVFLQGLLQYGYVHADPHGGNIAVSKEGQIILYDFGLVGRYDQSMIDSFRTMVRCFMCYQTNEMIDCVLQNEIIYMYESKHARKHSDLTPSEYVVLYNLTQYLFEYSKTTDINVIFNKLKNDPYINSSSMPFYFNSNMVLLFKTFTTLEGVCKGLNDNFSYTNLYTSILRNIIDIEFINTKIITDIDILMKNNGDTSKTEYVNTAKMNVMNDKVISQNKIIYILIITTIIELILF